MRPLQTVLLIDDDPTEAALVEYGLSHVAPAAQFHYEQDSAKALDRIREVQPDLVFLDLFMPCPDGFALADEIHRHLGNRAPTVIAFSSSVLEGQPVDHSVIWADACLTKPREPGEYAATFRAALACWRKRRAILCRNRQLRPKLRPVVTARSGSSLLSARV
ncbi:response regulator [Maricaulis sp. CAU 1757]